MNRIGNVNILGVDYEVLDDIEDNNPKLIDNSGLCELFTKKIILDVSDKDNKDAFDNMEEYYHKVLRHECFHAIFHEVGLRKYSGDEDLVDCLAILYPRIKQIMEVVDNMKLY